MNKNESLSNDRALLSVKEFCNYLGIGDTLARELLHEANCPYAIRLHGRIYANKKRLDKYLEHHTGNI